jgi:LEA14-like dessication related protein
MKIVEPQFRRLENFKIEKLGLQESTVGLNITYYNPNNFGVTVKEGIADLYLDSVYIGKFLQSQYVAVNKKAEFSLPLTGSVSMKTALQLNLMDISNREVFIKALGSIKVGKAGIYINRKIDYQGRHKLDIKL